jgi:hypothetical protein
MLLARPPALSAQQAEVPPARNPAPVQAPAQASAPDPHSAMEPEPTRLQFRGFADMRFRASNERDVPSTFSVGQSHLFITSQPASDLNLVGEVVFEADDQNRYSVDVDWRARTQPHRLPVP